MQSTEFVTRMTSPGRLLAALAVTLLAGGCASHPPGYYEFRVEKPAHALPDNPAPLYPAELLATRPTGRVLMTFVVTKAGVIDTSTVRVIESSHPLFEAAARAVLQRWRFLPAEVGGRLVSQQVQVPFIFTPPPA